MEESILTKVRRRLTVLSAIFVIILNGQLVQAQDGNKLKIGFSMEAMKGERWQSDLNSFEARAKQLGAEVISRDAAGDDDLQLQQVKDMIKAGIKVLVLLPHDPTMANRMVDAAKAANVKVISYDRLVPNSDVDLYVSFDRLEIGRMQAEYLVKQAPAGNYVLIAGKDAVLAALISMDGDPKIRFFKKGVKNEGERAEEKGVGGERGKRVAGDETVTKEKKKVPAILLKPVVVTKDNIKTTVVK